MTFGKKAGKVPTFYGVPDMRAETSMGVATCDCGCPGCQGCGGSSGICGCESSSLECPECGSPLGIDTVDDEFLGEEVCDECGYAEGLGCPECGEMMSDGICEACGYAESLSEGKRRKRKKKGPSKKTQKKAAKTMVKRAGKGKDKKVSMTKLAKKTKKWADDPWAAAQWVKQTAKE